MENESCRGTKNGRSFNFVERIYLTRTELHDLLVFVNCLCRKLFSTDATFNRQENKSEKDPETSSVFCHFFDLILFESAMATYFVSRTFHYYLRSNYILIFLNIYQFASLLSKNTHTVTFTKCESAFRKC